MKITTCNECKFQEKKFIRDRRMKNGGYWYYHCLLIYDMDGDPVDGLPGQFCSKAERKNSNSEWEEGD